MTEARGGESRRRRVTFHELIQLANFMTDRDREIALFLYRHQVLTTEQLELLFFPSRRAAQKRLLKLLEHVVVERFYPPIPYGQGKQQAHWVLGDAGVKLVAACLEVEPQSLGLQRRDDWGAHPQLVHRLEVNSFVTELVRATLQDPAMGRTGSRSCSWSGRRSSPRRPNSCATVRSRRSGETSPTRPSRGPCPSSCRSRSSRLGWTGRLGAAGATTDSTSRVGRRCGTT